MAVTYWVEQMSLDDKDREKQRHEEFIEELHESFMENHMLAEPVRNSWIR